MIPKKQDPEKKRSVQRKQMTKVLKDRQNQVHTRKSEGGKRGGPRHTPVRYTKKRTKRYSPDARNIKKTPKDLPEAESQQGVPVEQQEAKPREIGGGDTAQEGK